MPNQNESRQAIAFRLALQCAPLFLKVKPAELFAGTGNHWEYIREFLAGTEISVMLLGETSKGQVYLLYRKDDLQQLLKEQERILFLDRIGYSAKDWKQQLHMLKIKFQCYCEKRGEFPHEIGLFLGYPVEDVKGFIRNEGKDCLYSGYWKVYSDVERKKKLFHTYDQAKRLMYLVASGAGMEGGNKA